MHMLVGLLHINPSQLKVNGFRVRLRICYHFLRKKFVLTTVLNLKRSAKRVQNGTSTQIGPTNVLF